MCFFSVFVGAWGVRVGLRERESESERESDKELDIKTFDGKRNEERERPRNK